MSDETPNEPIIPAGPSSGPPAGPPGGAPPGRARIEPAAAGRRMDGLPILYVIGFVALAVAVYYVYRHPMAPRGAVQEAARVDALTKEAVARQQEYDILSKRLGALEAKPGVTPGDLSAIESKVSALEKRPTPPAVDLGPLTARVDGLEKRQAADLGPIRSQVEALGKRQDAFGSKLEEAAGRLGPVASRLDALAAAQAGGAKEVSGKLDGLQSTVAALGQRLDGVEGRAMQNAAALGSLKGQAQQVGQLQAANVALNAGQALGEIAGAPPALARFAHASPPTESGLRLSFETAAEAARHASQPALTDNQNLLDRMWTRAQQAVTIRQGDNVIVGDPISGVLESSRQKLDAGDLLGAVTALDGLAGPARAAMSGWIGQAQSLLDARAAIAQMASRS